MKMGRLYFVFVKGDKIKLFNSGGLFELEDGLAGQRVLIGCKKVVEYVGI